MTSPAPEVPRRARMASRILVLVLVGIFLLGTAGFLAAVLWRPAEAADADGPGSAAVASASFVLPASPSASPSEDPGLVRASVPVVPVSRFWGRTTGLDSEAVVRALRTGEVSGFRRVVVEAGIREALAEALGITIAPSVGGGDLASVGRAVSRRALGFVAAPDVIPRMRALEVDGRSLFGNERLRDLDRWPLHVEVERPADGLWSQPDTWVLVAGGDSFTDRGVYDSVVRKGRGVDYPFGGGTARVTGKRCCDPVFRANVVPTYVLTGNRGRVRRIFRSADLAIVNHESPITDAWQFHSSGLRFSGRPDLTRIFTRAGIDWVSLANNHIKDYGSEGIRDTRRILRRYGIRFGGAGRDLEQARRFEVLEVGGTRVAIIPCVGVAAFAWADEATSGGTPCKNRYIVPDIKRAAREAEVVIAFPHWGFEYTRRPTSGQRRLAARWVKAGADLVLGAHSHVAGAIEDIGGVPVLYSLGNLIFDQHWSTPTMESFILEASFHGPRLAQLRLHPFISHAQSQPNLLDPARGEGRLLLREMRAASSDWLDW